MFRQFVRRFATLQKTGKPESTVLKDPVRQVFISQSNDVFTNLALEDWLYRHHDFAHKVRNPPKNRQIEIKSALSRTFLCVAKTSFLH